MVMRNVINVVHNVKDVIKILVMSAEIKMLCLQNVKRLVTLTSFHSL